VQEDLESGHLCLSGMVDYITSIKLHLAAKKLWQIKWTINPVGIEYNLVHWGNRYPYKEEPAWLDDTGHFCHGLQVTDGVEC
jgi:hypothetical protein